MKTTILHRLGLTALASAKFTLLEEVDSKNFKITDSLKDIEKWKAKVIEGNQGNKRKGSFDSVVYVMISLKDNTIVPIADSDGHKTGYDVMYTHGIADPYDNYYPISPSSDNHPITSSLDKFKLALNKAKDYGLDLDKTTIYMRNISPIYDTIMGELPEGQGLNFWGEHYEDAYITARSFLDGDYGNSIKLGRLFTPLTGELLTAFETLSETFESESEKPRPSALRLKNAVKYLYKIGNKIKLGSDVFISKEMYDSMVDSIADFKNEAISFADLEHKFFGFNGFRNILHKKLKDNIKSKKLIEQIGNVAFIVKSIGAI